MNTSVTLTSLAPEAAVIAPMPASRLVYSYFVEAKYEFLKMLRTPAFSAPVLVLPVVMYLMFGLLMSRDAVAANPGLGTYLFCGYAVFGATFPGLLGIGISVALERDAGFLKLKRALPAPPGAYLLAKMLMAMLFAAITTTSLVITAALLGKLSLSVPQAAALTATLMIGTLPMCAIGLLIGSYATGSAAPAVANLVFLPMMWLSGLFFPLPAFMQKWVVVWPAFHLDQLAVAAVGLKGFRFMPPLMCLGVLAGVTVLFGGLALRRLAQAK